MKEFIDKLIERLEEYRRYAKYIEPQIAVESCINITKELAEEYKGKNIGDLYISRTEVLKLIEDIKCDDSIPKNYGTLLDIMREIRNMPTLPAPYTEGE